MKILRKTDFLFWFSLTIFLTGCFLRYYVIWVWDLSKMLPVYVSDDMFYYLKTAKNFFLGYGASFDGIHLTNGFHPLYMCFLILFYKIIPNFGNRAVEFTLSFLALVQIATGLVLWFIADKLFKNRFSNLVCVFIFLLHPFNLFTGLSGVEAPLAVFFLAVSFLYYLYIRGKDKLLVNQSALMGIFFGLSCLSRTDSVFFLAGIIADFIFFRIVYKRYSWRRQLFNLLIIFSVSFFLLSVWFIWSFLNFHTITQDSMRAILFWKNKWQAGKILFYGQGLQEPILKTFFFMSRRFFLTFFQWRLSALVFIIYAGLSLVLNKRNDRNISPLLFVSLGLAGLWLFYFFYLNHEQKWYYLSTAFIFSIWCGVIAESIITAIGSVKIKSVFKTVTVIVIGLYLYLYGYDVLYPWHIEQAKMALILKNYVPSNEKVGSFNAGIYGYFSGLRVVNLDGVTNHSVLSYLEKNRLYDYLKAENIKYIVDYKGFFDACKPFGAKKITGIDAPDAGEIILFKIN